MKEPVPIIEGDKTFTPFYFYNDFIKRVAEFYRVDYKEEIIEFNLAIESDLATIGKNYYIEPISLPLLVSLGEQLKNYHDAPIKLNLLNNPATVDLLKFLDKADFFNLVGNNKNLSRPIGKNIFRFKEDYLGNYKEGKQRSSHKIRGYSLIEDGLANQIKAIHNDEDKRDYLVGHYTPILRKHFEELLFENSRTNDSVNFYIEILSELITNGVLHSNSNVYALMFLDRFNTKFSISDNGIGLYESLSFKEDSFAYQKFLLFKELEKVFDLNVSINLKNAILSIFETLFYSMIKVRLGLFDLMCNVVLENGGIFRLHNNNAQIIISHRMLKELSKLFVLRKEILEIHNKLMFGKVTKQQSSNFMKEKSKQCQTLMISFAKIILSRYTKDIKFAPIRFYEIKFKGVHVEVEIPNMDKEL